MSYFTCTKSNIIIKEGETTRELVINNADMFKVGELLEDIMLKDFFLIKGIGMLAIKTISIRQFEDTIDFFCYPIDTELYY